MKILKIAIAGALLSGCVYANETLANTMAKMENGLSQIQKGFLYNEMSLVKNGVKDIESANALFKDKDATKAYLPKDKQHMTNIAFNAAKRMNAASEEMLTYVDAHEMSKAQHSYSEIINACGSCHAVVRGW